MLLKVSPLAAWTWDQVWNYTGEHAIEHLPLYDFGYPQHRLRAMHRDSRRGRRSRGRAAGAARKLECGIHTESKRADE